MGVTLLPSDPYYSGSALASSEVPGRVPVAIGGRGYVIEVEKYRRGVVEQLRQASDDGTEPGEQSFNTEGLWKRAQADWSLGAGQDYLDDPQSSSRRRFRMSRGVDIWAKFQASLLHDVELKTGGPTTFATLVQTFGTRLYVAGGASLYFTSDPEVAAPTWSTIVVGSTVLDFTTDGTYVYIATAAGMYRVTLGSTVLGAIWAAGNWTHVRYANGRLLGTTSAVLNEISAAAGLTVVKTLSFTGYSWGGITPAPNGIYAWATGPDDSEVYYIGTNTTTGALNAAVQAMTTPRGETLNVAEAYGGAMILGTTVGLRLATVSEAGGLNYGPAIEVGSVSDLDQRGKFCWYTLTNFDGAWSGLGRANLAEFTEELVPAYTSDLLAQSTATSLGVAWMAGRHYFTINGEGLYGEVDTLVEDGDLYSGHIRYGNYERKIVSSIDVRTDPLAGEVEMHLHMEDGEHVHVATHDSQGSLSQPTPAIAQGADGESVEVHLVLVRSATDDEEGPVLRRYILRSLPTPSVVEEFLVPIIMHDQVKNERGLTITYNPLTEYSFLLDLVNSKTPTMYQEGTSSYLVYVSRIEVQPKEWNDSLSFFEGLIVVRLVTVQPTS